MEKILKTLADKNRLKIMEILYEESLRVSEVAEILDIEENLASHHLRVLSKNNICKSKRKGREVTYSINKTKLISFTKALIKKQFIKEILKEATKQTKNR